MHMNGAGRISNYMDGSNQPTETKHEESRLHRSYEEKTHSMNSQLQFCLVAVRITVLNCNYVANVVFVR